jgi:hypothetical protein
MQGRNSSCYASTSVIVFSEDRLPVVSYATTSVPFNYTSNSLEINPDWELYPVPRRISTRVNLSEPEYYDYNGTCCGNIDLNLINTEEAIGHTAQYSYNAINLADTIAAKEITGITAAYCNGTPITDIQLEYLNDGNLEIEIRNVTLEPTACYDVLILLKTDGEEMMLAIVAGFLITGLLFAGLGILNDTKSIWGNRLRWAAMIMAFLQVVMMAGSIYGIYIGANIGTFLLINMWVTILIGFGLMVFTLFIKTITFMNPGDIENKDKW